MIDVPHRRACSSWAQALDRREPVSSSLWPRSLGVRLDVGWKPCRAGLLWGMRWVWEHEMVLKEVSVVFKVGEIQAGLPPAPQRGERPFFRGAARHAVGHGSTNCDAGID